MKRVCLAFVLCLVAASVANGGVSVDTFNYGNVEYDGPSGSIESSVSGTLGGNRDTTLNIAGCNTLLSGY